MNTLTTTREVGREMKNITTYIMYTELYVPALPHVDQGVVENPQDGEDDHIACSQDY